MKLYFEWKVNLKYYGLLIMHMFCKNYDIKVFWYRSDLYSQPNYVSMDPVNEDLYVGTQWILLVGVVRWYSMDPASGDYMLVFNGPPNRG